MELLMDMEKMLSVAKVEGESHDLISSKQSDRAMGGRVEVGLVER